MRIGRLHLLFIYTVLLVYPAFGQGQFRALYLSGNVTLEDGSPPPDPARIELVCSGRIQPQALTKSDGSFNFRVGGDQSQQITAGSADRSQPQAPVGTSGPFPAGGDVTRGVPDTGARYANPSFVNMSQCEVRAALAGYRSSSVKLGRRSVFESPDIGSLVLIPLAPGEEPPRDHLVSVNTLKAPKKAVEAYDTAVLELSKEKPNPKKASKELEKAVKEYPEFSEAWYLLGEARIRMNDLDKAQEALTKSVETDPGFVKPSVTLAMLELERGDLEAAVAASEKALSLVPELAEAQYYQGTAYAKLGDAEKAKASLEQVVSGPEEASFPRAHYILGVLAAQAQDVQTAVTHCRRYLELEPESDAAAAVRKQLDSWKAAGIIE